MWLLSLWDSQIFKRNYQWDGNLWYDGIPTKIVHEIIIPPHQTTKKDKKLIKILVIPLEFLRPVKFSKRIAHRLLHLDISLILLVWVLSTNPISHNWLHSYPSHTPDHPTRDANCKLKFDGTTQKIIRNKRRKAYQSSI